MGWMCYGDLAPVVGPSLAEMKRLRAVDWCQALCTEVICLPETRSMRRVTRPAAGWLNQLVVRAASGWTYHSERNSAVDAKTHQSSNEANVDATYWQRQIDGRVLG